MAFNEAFKRKGGLPRRWEALPLPASAALSGIERSYTMLILGQAARQGTGKGCMSVNLPGTGVGRLAVGFQRSAEPLTLPAGAGQVLYPGATAAAAAVCLMRSAAGVDWVA